MGEPSTYIKLDRHILEWGWYQDANTTRLFIHLLLKANIKDKEWMGNKIQRGDLATSYSNLAKELDMSIQNVRTALEHLKLTSEVTIKSHNKYTIITISNYDKYQCDNTQANKQVTNNQQTTNKQLTTTKEYKEYKNDKNVKNNNTSEFDLFWNEYPKKTSKADAKKAFDKAIKKTDINQIIEAIRIQKRSEQWQKENGQFIPYPATWLNKEKWSDELIEYKDECSINSERKKREFEMLAKEYGG